MKSVPEVRCDISGLRVNRRSRPSLPHFHAVIGMVVRARQEVQLPGFLVGLVKLDADVHPGAEHGMPAHSAIAVPREVGKPFYDPSVLHHHAVAVQSVAVGQQLLA